MKTLLTVFSLWAAVCLAGPAHGDPDDTSGSGNAAFFASLKAAGITYADADLTVEAAHTVCELVGDGKPGSAVLRSLRHSNPALTPEHAAQFIGIAVQSYCPDRSVPTDSSPAGPSPTDSSPTDSPQP